MATTTAHFAVTKEKILAVEMKEVEGEENQAVGFALHCASKREEVGDAVLVLDRISPSMIADVASSFAAAAATRL